MASGPTPRRTWHGAAFPALLAILAAALLLMPRQALTGDETRYVLYAASLLRHGGFEMPVPEWSALHEAANGVPTGDLPRGGGGVVMMNPVYLPALLSPVSFFFPLGGPRLAALLAGLGGLGALHRLCRLAAPSRAALLAAAFAACSMPLLPYLHIFYMEAFMFSLVCLAWWRVQRRGQVLGADLATAALIAAIPIVHMRGSVVAAALYGFLLWPAVAGRDVRRAALLALPGAAGLALLVGLNLLVYGAVTGPVNTARPPLPWAWTEVLPMQLFNVRHGLLAYAPIWVLGYGGLAAGALQGTPLARQGLLLAAVAALTGVGVNPGECWPARFWVLSVPMLAVGLSIWTAREHGLAMRLPTVLLGAVTLINAALFLVEPNSFLENRQSAVTYQILFDRGLKANFGLILPVELPDPAQGAVVAYWLLFFGALFLLSIGAARRPGWRWGLPMVLLLGGGLAFSLVRNVHPSAFALAAKDGAAQVSLHAPRELVALQFGRPWETWNYGALNLLDMELTRADGTTVQQRLLANQVVGLRCFGPLSAIRLSSPTGLDVAGQAGFRLRLYRPATGLSGWAARLGQGCG